MSNYIGLAGALARVAVTDWQSLVLVHVGARWVALAGLAILRLSRLSNCSGVAEETRLASLASEPSSIIHTPQTFPSDSITVPNGIRINIAIAVTLATCPGWSLEAVWIPKVAISTLLTTSTVSALRALSTDGAGWIIGNLKACAHSHLAS